MTEVDFYRRLGLPRGASVEEVDAAFRRRAAGADPERMRDLELARIVLSDPVRRARYDAWLRDDGEDGEELQPPPSRAPGPATPVEWPSRPPERPAPTEEWAAPTRPPAGDGTSEWPWRPPERAEPAAEPVPPSASGPAPAPVREEPGPAGLAFLAALGAALAGAVVWALVVRATAYEVGVLAWAIGFVAAGAARLVARGNGVAVQFAAALAAALGVLAGKYLGYALVVQDELPGAIGLFSADMWSFFRDDLRNVFGPFDLLWLGLAVGTAWYLLRPEERGEGAPTPAQAQTPAREERHHSRNPVDRLTRGLPHGWRVTIDWVVTIVGAIAIVLAIKAWVVNPYRIPSSSMEPSLHCARPAVGCEARFSDRVLANRFIYHFREPHRGDVVVFETPPAAQARCGAGGTFVKRIIGLPGEKLDLRAEGGDTYVYVDGRKLDESGYLRPERRSAGEFETFEIPPDHYFMMGDNRTKSCDSREWGTVPRENLIGKVFATYWPPNRIGFR